MADWGLLGSLRGRDNWQEIKAEKQRELQYQQVMNTMLEQDIQDQQQKQAAIQQYMNTANKLEVMPVGMERIKALDEPLKKKIADNIKRFGGDLDKYWKVQGQVDMQNYLNQLLNNPTTVREMMNASAAARWQADKQAGLQERGEIDPMTGQLVEPFEVKLQKYNTGDIDALDYAGAFKPLKTDEKIFETTLFGDKNPYKKVPVGVDKYTTVKYLELRDAGLSEADAQQQARQMGAQYRQHLNTGGSPLFHKSVQWKPTKAWGDEHAAEISAKYIVDGFNALLDPNNTQIWSDPKEVVLDESTGSSINIRKAKVQEANVFPDFSLGKKTITYNKQTNKYDESGNSTGAEIQQVTESVDDAIEPFTKVDGKVYMQTTANRLQGNPPMLLTPGSIDKMFAGVSKTPKVLQVIATMRNALLKNKHLTEAGRPEFDSDNAVVEYVDANGNDVDLADATEEQIQQALDGGIIRPK